MQYYLANSPQPAVKYLADCGNAFSSRHFRLVIMAERIILKNDDVVSISVKRDFMSGASTLKAKEVKQRLCNLIPNLAHQEWFLTHVPCEVLLDRRDKWMKGRARLVIEFIPENPEAEQKYISPLDDLRKLLKIEE